MYFGEERVSLPEMKMWRKAIRFWQNILNFVALLHDCMISVAQTSAC
jgi:hypothetical protein